MAITSLRLLVARLPVDPDLAGSAHERVLGPGPSAALISVGGAVGALLRALIEGAVPSTDVWAWGTLIINVSGAGALALLLVVLEERYPLARVPRPLIGTGLLGGYTTFSTFAVDTVQIAHAGRLAFAIAYVAVSTLGAVGAALAGVIVGRAAARLANRSQWLRRLRHAGLRDSGEAE